MPVDQHGSWLLSLCLSFFDLLAVVCTSLSSFQLHVVECRWLSSRKILWNGLGKTMGHDVKGHVGTLLSRKKVFPKFSLEASRLGQDLESARGSGFGHRVCARGT